MSTVHTLAYFSIWKQSKAECNSCCQPSGMAGVLCITYLLLILPSLSLGMVFYAAWRPPYNDPSNFNGIVSNHGSWLCENNYYITSLHMFRLKSQHKLPGEDVQLAIIVISLQLTVKHFLDLEIWPAEVDAVVTWRLVYMLAKGHSPI